MTALFRVILILALIGGMILLVQQGADEPGMVALSWYGYHVETSATVLVALVNAVIILAFFGGRFFGWVADIPLRFRNKRQHRKDQRALALLALGLEAQAAGDEKALKKLSGQLQKALPAPKGVESHPLVARLTAQLTPTTDHLHTLLGHKENAFTGHVGLMQEALKHKNWTTAIFHAKGALKARPHSPKVQFQLLEAQLHAGHYVEAQETVKTIKETPYGKPEASFYNAAIGVAAAKALAKENPAQALKTVQQVVKAEPLFVPAVFFLASAQQQLGKASVAERTLADFFQLCPRFDVFQKWWALAKQNNPNLAADKLMKKVQNLLESVDVLDVEAQKELCRATAYLEIGELHPAQDAAQKAFQLSPNQMVLSTLANVEDRLGHIEAASGWRAEALQASPLQQIGDELLKAYQAFLEEYGMLDYKHKKEALNALYGSPERQIGLLG